MIFLRDQMAVHATAKGCLRLVEAIQTVRSGTGQCRWLQVIRRSPSALLTNEHSSSALQLMPRVKCYMAMCTCAFLTDRAAA